MEDCELELDEMCHDCLMEELRTRWATLVERARIPDSMLEGKDMLVSEECVDAVDTVIYRLINFN